MEPGRLQMQLSLCCRKRPGRHIREWIVPLSKECLPYLP